MNIQRINAPIRFFLLFVSTIIWVGIWHTGFNIASWVLYIPAAFLLLAAIIGICPGMIFANMLFGKKSAPDS